VVSGNRILRKYKCPVGVKLSSAFAAAAAAAASEEATVSVDLSWTMQRRPGPGTHGGTITGANAAPLGWETTILWVADADGAAARSFFVAGAR
jgi:hypothetical protein